MGFFFFQSQLFSIHKPSNNCLLPEKSSFIVDSINDFPNRRGLLRK
jgi:hypothetical protein